MSTSVADIREWLKAAKKQTNVTHVIIACDTFEYEDFPVYVHKGEDVRERARHYQNPSKMSTVMEVYSLTGKHSMEDQLNSAGRNFNYD